MSENKRILRVENNTARFIVGPPTPSFPMGLKLQPGLNTWPAKYDQEIQELCSAPSFRDVVENGQLVKKLNEPRYMGRRWLEEMQKPVMVYTTERASARVTPQLTFYYEAMEDREDGPEPPAMLPANEKAALAIVNATTIRQKAHLERWLTASNVKGAVKAAIEAKLHA